MKFGIFTGPYRYGSLETAFRDAAEFGYDFVELWGGRPHAYSYDIINDASTVLSLIDKYSLPVKVYTPEHNDYPFNYMLGDMTQWEKCMDYFRTSLKVSKILGAEYMLVSIGHGGNPSYEKRWERLALSLRKLSNMAEDEGQRIILETLTQYESDTCTTLNEYINVLNTVNSPLICPMVDLVPPFVQKENPADYIRYFKDRLKHMHLVDSDGVSDTHLIPGDGIMDLKSILKEFTELGFNGTATVELVTHYIDRPSYYAELALKKTKELFL